MNLRALLLSMMLIFSVSFVLVEFAPIASGAIITVDDDGPADHNTIQDAINAANVGDTVYVNIGTYDENVNVDKTITLEGAERDLTIIDAGGSGDVVSITASWVNMTGFTVTGGGWGQNNGGIELSNVGNCSVTNCYVTGNTRDGIRVLNTMDSTVEDNLIEDNGDEGIHIQGSFRNDIINNTAFNHHSGGGGGTADGILVYLSIDNNVIDNNLYDNDIGINVIQDSHTNIISGNTVDLNTQYGIGLSESTGNILTFNTLAENGIFIQGGLVEHWNTHSIDNSNTVNGKQAYYWKDQTGGTVPVDGGEVILANCTDVIVTGQTISNSSVGIEIGFSSNTTITLNEIMNQTYGIYLSMSEGNLLEDNTLYSSYYGVYIESADDNILNDNTIYSNYYGINIYTSDNNSLTNNEITDCTNYGIFTWDTTNHTIKNNNVTSNFDGIYIRQASLGTIMDNNITGSDIGFYIRDSSTNNIMGNSITDNNWGIWIRQAPLNDFTGNNISLNTLGIRVRAAEDNNIKSNDLFGNTDYGIYITSASYRNWIENNTITDSEIGVNFVRWNQWRPSNNFVVDNIISDCEAGIYLNAVLSNNLSANTMTNCGIFIDGDQLNFWNEHFIDTLNTVNGKPVYYWKNQTGGTVLDNAGEVILANCTNVNLQNAETTWGTVGIELGFSNLVTLTLNNASFNNWYGIYLYASNGNTIWGNTASYNTRSGIHLGFSESNVLTSNIMALDGIWIEGWSMNYWNTHDIDTANEVNGKPVYYWKDQTGGSVPSDAGEVILANCTNVLVKDSNPDWGTVGVLIGFSNDCIIDNNNLSYNRYGLYLTNSDGNTILNNTVSYNTDYGIQLQVTDNNLIYHNNIIGNTNQADDDQPGNFWNETYSISGNYWSDYVGNDTFNGPLQDLLGPDGIGDTPHALGNGRFDNYPLIDPWDPVRTTPSEPLSLVAVAGKIYVNLTWNPPASDGGYPVYTYHVYRGLSAGTETFYMDAGNTLTFNDTSVTAGENYFYVIVAVNILGEGSQSNRESAMPFSEPSEPLGLMTDSGNSYVNLTWSPPANDGGYAITNYTIYRGEVPGVPTYIVEIGDMTYFNDTTAINGITYYYNITATNTIGEGPKSNEISDTPATVPSAPWGVSILEGDGFLNVTWNVPVDDGGSTITYYNFYRSDLPGVYQNIPAGQLYYNDSAVTNGIQYDYTISAVNSKGEGQLSPVEIGIPKRPPFAVVSLQADIGDMEVNLTWLPPSNDGGSPVTGYKIYKGTESGNLSLIATIGDILYYKDTSVINGNTYYYIVTALNIVGEGSPSLEIDAIPATVPNEPTGLSAQAGDSYIELTWAAPTDDGGSAITKYVIYRGTSQGTLTLHTEIDALETYTDTSVTNGVTYYYKVSAKNPAGEGPRSNEANGLPQRNPSIPLNLDVETGVSYVLLTWEAPASDGGAPITNYKIYRGESSGAETFLVEIADVLSYNDTAVTNGVEYFYKVGAVNDVGDSDLSNEASGIPYEFPGAPLNMAIVSGDGFVAISWEAPTSEGSSSVTNYLIFRGDASETETFFKEIGNVLFYNDTSVTNGDTYYYYVIAKNSEGQGPHGDEVSATPKSVPGMATNLVAEEGNSYVDLSWDAPTSDGGSAITNYKIYRGTTSGSLTLLVEIGNVLTYNDTTAENGVTYYYVIAGVNSVGEAPRTGEISATPFIDTDGDNTPDHLDTDDDDDGVPDTEEDKNGNGIVDPGETDPLNSDTDGDTYNDKEDAYPTNPDKWEEDEPEEGFPIWILLLILIIVIVLVLFLATRKKGEPKEEIPTKEEDEGPEFEPTEEPEEGDMEKEEDLPAPDDEDLPPPEDMEPSEDEAPKDEITESEEPMDEVADTEESPSEDVEPKGDEPLAEDTEPPVEDEPAVDEKPENTESDSQEKLDQIIEDLNNGNSSPDSEIKD